MSRAFVFWLLLFFFFFFIFFNEGSGDYTQDLMYAKHTLYHRASPTSLIFALKSSVKNRVFSAWALLIFGAGYSLLQARGSYPVHCRIFDSISGCYLVDKCSNCSLRPPHSHPQLCQPIISPDIARSPLGAGGGVGLFSPSRTSGLDWSGDDSKATLKVLW